LLSFQQQQQHLDPPIVSSFEQRQITANSCSRLHAFGGGGGGFGTFRKIQQHPNNPLFDRVARPGARPEAASTRLHAFGGGTGGGGFDLNSLLNAKTPLKIESKKEPVQQLAKIVTSTVKQATSGFMSGYVLGSIWGFFRGPSLTVASRGIAWGLDFGILSALFSGTTSITEFILAVLPAQKEQEKSTKSAMTRQQKVSLWSVVIRNVILALYFNRNAGIPKTAGLAVLYGGLSYYFIKNKIKSDAQRMSMLGGGGNMPGGQADAMQQLLQMMAMQQQSQTQTTIPKPQPSSSANTPPKASSPKASSSSLFNDKNKSKRENAMDVEFEKVDPEEGDA